MGKVFEGQLMMNVSCEAIRSYELVWVESIESKPNSYTQKVIITNKLGYRVKTDSDNLVEVQFFLHPVHGILYVSKYALRAIQAGGSLGSIQVPMFSMFTESQDGYTRDIKKYSVHIKDLIILGDVNDLDKECAINGK